MSENNGFSELLEEYKSLIEIAVIGDSLHELENIKESYQKELPENYQIKLEAYQIEMLQTKSEESVKKKKTPQDFFIKKQNDGLDLWNKKQPFGAWLSSFYLPNFHTLKKPSVQAPIAASLMLLNSNFYMRDIRGLSLTPLGSVMCLGFPGSGKTTYAKQLLKFHNPCLIIENRNSTNISIIENISDINQRFFYESQPAPTVLLDNLDKDKGKDDFIIYKDLFISTKPDESIRSISKRTTNLEGSGIFNYYAYTIGTTVYDIRPLGQTNQFYDQIASRCFFLMFEKRLDYLDLDRYSWEGFRYVYQEFWANPENQKEYADIFDEFPDNHSDFGFPSRRAYDISKIPMATGIIWGVFTDLLEALTAFSEYWKSLDILVDVLKDPYLELIRTYVCLIHPRKLEEKRKRNETQREEYGWEVPLDIRDEIDKQDVDRYLQQMCGVRLSVHQWRTEIPRLLRSLGYKHDEFREGYVFVKE